ncbi:MAG: sulfite exporter TauE/SafE family protein [Candidatus Eisenbacteria bacterium]
MGYRGKALIWSGLVVVLFLAFLARGEVGPASRVVLVLSICFLCELVDSGLGMGYGTILTPALLALGYPLSDIVPTVLFSELLSGLAASFFHNEIRNVDLRPRGTDLTRALLLAGGSVVGVSAGVFLSFHLPAHVLKAVVGAIIALAGLFVVLHHNRLLVYRSWKMLLLSVVAAFNKAMSGGGYGPLVTSGQILSGVEGRAAVGITSFAEAFTCAFGVALFLAKGGYIETHLFLPMATGALLSVPLSVFAIRKARERLLRLMIGILTMLLGGWVLYRAF